MKTPWIFASDTSSPSDSGQESSPSSLLSSSSASVKLPQLTLPIKKDVASLFVRDVTKKKIEGIFNSIEQLQKDLVDINEKYEDASDKSKSIFHKILDTSLALDQEKVFLQEKIKTSGFTLSDDVFRIIIASLQSRTSFIESLVTVYVQSLEAQNKQYPKKKQLSDQEIDQHAFTYQQSLQVMFD